MNVSKDQRMSITFEHAAVRQGCVIDGAGKLIEGWQ
jgi:hypothetical protein